MEELMTFDEMRRRFKSEWILVSDPEVDEHFHVVRGKVVFHSKDRDEVYRQIVERRFGLSAGPHTGRKPEKSAMVEGGRRFTRREGSCSWGCGCTCHEA